MKSIASSKAVARTLPVIAILCFLASAIIGLISVEVSVMLIGLGLVATVVWLLIRQRVHLHDLRTVVRQVMRESIPVNASVNTTEINKAAQRLEKAVKTISVEQSPVARELHSKTIEEIRYLQSQLSKALDK
ncbi:hypothetical protein [Glutamicibacter sp. PS]|uniref:hypothetical protein n=1 Tax=Glutamicibacter sp. PS TaxID=3075634 RepID=UPI00283D7012|nr:hypothetical protein [Glutamicibacter sp. PS]MDR4533023.1 hypothetical protein [Glutamicibacter sp. PS]